MLSAFLSGIAATAGVLTVLLPALWVTKTFTRLLDDDINDN